MSGVIGYMCVPMEHVKVCMHIDGKGYEHNRLKSYSPLVDELMVWNINRFLVGQVVQGVFMCILDI